MNAEAKLEHIKELTRKRQEKYMQNPQNALKQKEANRLSYLKRKEKGKEPKKEVSFASPYGEAEKDESMEKELKAHIKQLKEDSELPTTIKVKKSTLAKIAKIKLSKKKSTELKDDYEYLEKIIKEKIEKKSSQDTYLNSLKRLFNLFNETYLSKIFERKDLIPTIKTQVEAVPKVSKGRGVSAVAADIQTLLKMNTIAELGINEKLIEKIKLAHDASKIETLDKAADKSYPALDEYFKKLEDSFGKDSKQFALAELMSEVPTRDDLILKVVDSIKTAKDTDTNYIVLNKSPIARIVIHRFKTDKGFGKLDKPLSTRLTNILKKYMNSKKEDDKEYLFGNKKLSKFVGDMNKKMGFLKGGVNLLRHMAVQKFLSVPRTADEKAEYAEMMKHSPATQTKYNMNKKE
jgi:hypothetical protein